MISTFTLLAAAGWSALLVPRRRDRRLAAFAALLLLVVVVLMLTGAAMTSSLAGSTTLRLLEAGAVAAGALSLLFVGTLGRVASRHGRPRWRRGGSPMELVKRVLEPADETRIGFEKAIETMQLGVTVTDTAGKILYSNPADAAMHGYTRAELIAKDVRVFGVPGSSRTLTVRQLDSMKSWQREALNARKDGSTFPVHLMSDVIKDPSGDTIGVVTTCEDITERKRVEDQLVHDALHDALTGLPNRNLLLTFLESAVQRTQRGRRTFSVLFVDLDRFKLVNDSLGHMIGDRLLVAVADRLRHCVRPGDVVARLGGDEFTILLDDIQDARDPTRVSERIHEALHVPVELEGHDIFVTASIGIALGAAGQQPPEVLLRDADTAMYRAKADGGGRTQLFDSAMHERAVAQLRLESDMRRALERDEFLVNYQPIILLKTGLITGFEALVRWQPSGGGRIVPPGDFIPVAEETGLIVPIGWWVMQTACRQTRQWMDQFPEHPGLSVAVNLSARHFQQPDLVERIHGILDETTLPPANLKLEITESMLMGDAESHVRVIRRLRASGIHVHIDDFGTGYSSLSYLQRFSVDTLKIDKSFISEAETNETWEIVQMIIALARDMGVKVIAEGVESEEQTRRLRALDCDHAQGFLFHRPVDADTAGALLAAQQLRNV